MPIRTLHDNYGKSKVRLPKVERDGNRHQIQNITLDISREGDFEVIRDDGYNMLCLPTYTIKKTVYALDGQPHEIEQIKKFGRRLASHFLENSPQVSEL